MRENVSNAMTFYAIRSVNPSVGSTVTGICKHLVIRACCNDTIAITATIVSECILAVQQNRSFFSLTTEFEYYYDGSCIEEPKCPTFCPLNYVPQCARGKSGNVQTFGNGCSLASHNCLNEDDRKFCHCLTNRLCRKGSLLSRDSFFATLRHTNFHT